MPRLRHSLYHPNHRSSLRSPVETNLIASLIALAIFLFGEEQKTVFDDAGYGSVRARGTAASLNRCAPCQMLRSLWPSNSNHRLTIRGCASS
jgi:hypothetical protein